MRILIPLVGSRGDVQPGAVLGVELERRGHTVVVGAPPNFVDFVGRAGLKARQFGPDVHALYSSPEGQRALAAGNTFKLMSMVSNQMAEYADRMDDELIDISSDAETADPHRHQVITLSATQPHEPGCGSIAPQGARGILAGSNSVETA